MTVGACLAITTLTAVRTSEPRIADVLQRLVNYSATAARLAERIEHSDLIVYVEPGFCRSRLAQSCFMVLPSPSGRRYARITVPLSISTFRMASLIGHELQHAVEVADAPSVVDPQTLVWWFGRIGFRIDAETFETQTAKRVEQIIHRELVGPTRSGCRPSPLE